MIVLIQYVSELFYRVNVNDIRGKHIADSVCKKAHTMVPIVVLQFKVLAMISSLSFAHLENVPVVDVVNPTENLENLYELIT